MPKQQASKRSRKHRKEAKFAGLPKNTGHPSHVSGRRYQKKGEFVFVGRGFS